MTNICKILIVSALFLMVPAQLNSQMMHDAYSLVSKTILFGIQDYNEFLKDMYPVEGLGMRTQL